MFFCFCHFFGKIELVPNRIVEKKAKEESVMDPWKLLAYAVAAVVIYFSYRKMKRIQKETCQNDCGHCGMDCPSRYLTNDTDQPEQKEEP